MKRIKTVFLLLISIILLTGCNTQTYNYSGNEFFYELGGLETDEINEKGGKVIVSTDQAFIEFNENTKDYNTYSKGEHEIESKDGFYNYYFINLKEVKDNTFGTDTPIRFTDETYGEVELNVSGVYDYKINDIRDFTSSFMKVDPEKFLEIEEYIRSIVVDTIVEEVVKLDVKFTDLSSYAETIRQTTVKALEDKGVTCNNLEIQSISLTEESNKKVKNIENNNLMLKNYIQNTTWIATDGSEIIFDKERFNWYLNKGDHTDNVQYGTFRFYIDALAVDYITEDLKSFGVTRPELDNLFASNELYNSNNFVVFSIELEGYKINGETSTINKPIYWYGFLLNNNQNLQVVNMTTATYYNFTKNGF